MTQIKYNTYTLTSAQLGYIPSVLAQFGAQGWQLISTVSDNYGVHFIFSQPTNTTAVAPAPIVLV